MKERWRALRSAPAGERFQRRFHARRLVRKRGLSRVLAIFGGTAVLVAGAVMLVAPGPGILVFALGAALVAEESLWMARLLDRSELRIRNLISTLRKNV